PSAGVLLFLLAAGAPGQGPPRLDPHGLPLPPGAVARMGVVRMGPAHDVTALALAPDGKTLAVGDAATVTLWDWTTRKPGRQWRMDKGSGVVRHLAFSPDGSLLAVGKCNDSVCLTR